METVCVSVHVIGLHAVQFGNNWIKKNPRTAKIGLGQGESNLAVRDQTRPAVLLFLNCTVCLFIKKSPI